MGVNNGRCSPNLSSPKHLGHVNSCVSLVDVDEGLLCFKMAKTSSFVISTSLYPYVL
jgi:hypothetical protein